VASRRHAHLTKSIPAQNDTLAAAPKRLQLWFSEGVALATTHVRLADASGAAIALSSLTRESMPGMDDKDMPVVVTLTKGIGTGSYTISWDTVSKDGDASKGTIRFVVR
jgi:methionine-rich copper-binding protein CopC